MGTPWMGFMQDEFNWKREKAAWSFGLFTTVLGLPTVFFYNEGVFGEYDYWAGTVSLVVFALAEVILFSWIFGMDKGWKEINMGADIKVPEFYRFVIKYITPMLLLVVFITSFCSPVGGDWGAAMSGLFNGNGWNLDNGSIIAQIMNKGLKEQIAQATDAATIAKLENNMFFINIGRLLLLSAFTFIAFIIYVAYNKRKKAGKIV